LEDRRNVSFSSHGSRIAFLFSEIIIKLNVDLITSNQLSDTGELERCSQPWLAGSIGESIGWQTEYFKCREFLFSALKNFPVI
jgi:hypothetical protein